MCSWALSPRLGLMGVPHPGPSPPPFSSGGDSPLWLAMGVLWGLIYRVCAVPCCNTSYLGSLQATQVMRTSSWNS